MAHQETGSPTPFAGAGAEELVVYRHGEVFDATGGPLRPDCALVVTGQEITAVLADAELSQDQLAGREVVDLEGRTVIPGLVDAHQHLATPPNRPVAEAALERQAYGGVTTIRDMADDLRQMADLARATRVGEIAGPDIHYAALMAGPGFFDDVRTWQVSQGETPGEVPWMQAITDSTDLRLAVAMARGTGARAVKIYADLPASLVSAITAEAHRQGLVVWAHAAVFPASPLEVVRAGVDVVSHVAMLPYQTQMGASTSYAGKHRVDPRAVSLEDPGLLGLIEEMRTRGTILDATASMWTRPEVVGEDQEMAELAKANAEMAAGLTALAHRSGVEVCAGTDYETDSAAAFPSLHEELIFLHQRCGLSPQEALLAATRAGARSAGALDSVGTLEPGKLANFVVLERSPLEDITNIRSIHSVVKRGRRLLRSDYPGSSAGHQEAS